MADMPTARWSTSSLDTNVIDGKIYVIGGAGGVTKVEMYDPATDTWAQKADMPTKRYHLSTAVVDGKIYAIGGIPRHSRLMRREGTSLPTVEVYDPETDTWTARADAPLHIDGSSASVVDGKIYVFGNWVDTRATTTVLMYDPATDTWSDKADMPSPRTELTTSVVNGKIYAMGGVGGANVTPQSSVDEYDPATDTWTIKADMPNYRRTSSVVVDGRIYLFGGGTADMIHYGACPYVYQYDPTTDTWTGLDDMPFVRMGHGAAVVDGKVYLIGGTETPHPNWPVLQEVWEFDLDAEG
jgi:N-acetylneuraminic acid mutarotase